MLWRIVATDAKTDAVPHPQNARPLNQIVLNLFYHHSQVGGTGNPANTFWRPTFSSQSHFLPVDIIINS